MNLFYYKRISEIKNEDGTTEKKIIHGQSFNLNNVIITSMGDDGVLTILISPLVEKINPIKFGEKINKQTKQIERIVTKTEITLEPIMIHISDEEDINRFFSVTNMYLYDQDLESGDKI